MSKAAYRTSSLLQQYGITAIFSQRHGGISPAPFNSLNLGFDLGDKQQNVQHNLQTLCQLSAVPIPHQNKQVHGIQHHWYQGQGQLHPQEGDILLSQQKGTALAVRTADCLPILLYAHDIQAIAAVHAGWRGTVQQVVQHAVEQLRLAGASTSHIIACVGPSIASCCFEVDAMTASQLTASHHNAKQHISQQHGKFFPDLHAINRLQLLQTGILAEHIESQQCCTCCHPEDYFSWRRDGKNSGRQLAIIALPRK